MNLISNSKFHILKMENKNSKKIDDKLKAQKLIKDNSIISLSNINQSSDRYCYFNRKSNVI